MAQLLGQVLLDEVGAGRERRREIFRLDRMVARKLRMVGEVLAVVLPKATRVGAVGVLADRVDLVLRPGSQLKAHRRILADGSGACNGLQLRQPKEMRRRLWKSLPAAAKGPMLAVMSPRAAQPPPDLKRLKAAIDAAVVKSRTPPEPGVTSWPFTFPQQHLSRDEWRLLVDVVRHVRTHERGVFKLFLYERTMLDLVVAYMRI